MNNFLIFLSGFMLASLFYGVMFIFVMSKTELGDCDKCPEGLGDGLAGCLTPTCTSKKRGER